MKTSRWSAGIACVLAAACGSAASPDEGAQAAIDPLTGIATSPGAPAATPPVAKTKPSASPLVATAPDATLRYWGGKIIKDPKIYAVYWGPSVQYQSHLDAFYASIVDSTYIDWLGEYDTSFPRHQTINRGLFGGAYVDRSPPAGSTIDDGAVQRELARMMDAGQLPDDGSEQNLYMVHFPPNLSITSSVDGTSCQQFCGYHDTFSRNGHNVYYAVIPDHSTAGCATGCGGGAVQDNLTSTSSHEIIEAITDPVPSGIGIAWRDVTEGEVGDICNQMHAQVKGFTVQKGWSNRFHQCVSVGINAPIDARPIPADYDNDGKTDMAVKGGNGVWYVDYARNGFGGAWDDSFGHYGGMDAVPVPGDYDGDHLTDLSVKGSDGVWYIDFGRDGFHGWNETHAAYGDATAIPVPADYDGDGKTDLSVKGADGVWYLDFARDGFGAWNEQHAGYGDSTALPAPADYDGDRRADLSVKGKDGIWRIDFARDGFGAWNELHAAYGDDTAPPIPFDYDRDGRADLSVKGADGVWYVDYARDGFGAWNESHAAYGGSWSIATPGDYDGDGKVDLSVKDTSGVWYVDLGRDGWGAWSFQDSIEKRGAP